MRKLLIACLMGFFLLGIAGEGHLVMAAEKYPVRPISFIVPVEAGAGADIVNRPFCESLEAVLGQPVVVVNKPGGGNAIGYREVHNAKPDGYTLGYGMGTVVTGKLLGLLPYDHRDLTILGGQFSAVPAIVASTKGERTFKTLPEVLEFAKLNPGKVKMATSSVGGSWWLFAMDFISVMGLKFNVIPQEGAGMTTMLQVAGGHTDIAVTDVATGKALIKAGNARLLAVFGDTRLKVVPDAPVLEELGIKLRITSWVGCTMAPPNMPRDLTERLVKAVETAAKDPKLERKNDALAGSNRCVYRSPKEVVEAYDSLRDTARGMLASAGILKEK